MPYPKHDHRGRPIGKMRLCGATGALSVWVPMTDGTDACAECERDCRDDLKPAQKEIDR